MLRGLQFLKGVVGEWYEFVCIQGTGGKIGGRVGFWGFISIGSGREHKFMASPWIMLRSSHMTSVNVERKGSPDQVIPPLQSTPAV